MRRFLREYLAKGRERRKRERDSSLYTFFRIEKPGHLLITKERIGLHEAEYFRKELTKYSELYKKDIVLNTAVLNNLDCSGVAAIIRAEAAARKNDAHITLKGLHGRAENAVEIMGLNRFLTFNYPR